MAPPFRSNGIFIVASTLANWQFTVAIRTSLNTLLSRNEANLPLALLGILVGLAAGLAVNLFRFALEAPFPFFGNGLHHDNFEALPPYLHFLLPVIGCIIIGQLLHFLTPELRLMGVSYVIDKVQNFRSRMPVRNAVMQFITASIALLSGGSCGREGPAIHMGATAGGAIGSWLQLPNNSIRTLIAAGSAAAIAAAFNTPVAGVIFAMEVILMEYAISGIIPVIIAAVSGTVVTQILYGGESVFAIDDVAMNSLWQIPYVVLMGLIIGIIASLFVKLHKFACGFIHIDLRLRLLLIGLLTGTVGLFMPEILGTGYDSLNDALQGNLALTFLIALLSLKLIVTALSLGLGLPGGVIGPSLMLGGLAGGIMGIVGESLLPGSISTPGFYVLIGMCAMMGATLQAPLAALMALLELSNNSAIILPAMLIIVVANLISSELFKIQSVFLNSLTPRQSGFSPELSRFLNRYAISSVASNKFATLQPGADLQSIREELEQNPDWLIIDYTGEHDAIIARASLELAMENADFDLNKLDRAREVTAINQQATLLEALETLAEKGTHMGYTFRHDHKGDIIIQGVFSQDDIMAFYKGTQ